MTSQLLIIFMLLAGQPAMACSTLLEQAEFRPLAGKERASLCERFKGDVLLVVNTASKCGFTYQYEGLEALHHKYSTQGFAVLGFPSNDFLWQEPGSEAEIKEFCTLTYGVAFPMFEKIHVKKGKAVPFYEQLAAESGGTYPGWNFHKYLIDRSGKVVANFGSRTRPDDASLVAAIEKAIAAPTPSAD